MPNSARKKTNITTTHMPPTQRFPPPLESGFLPRASFLRSIDITLPARPPFDVFRVVLFAFFGDDLTFFFPGTFVDMKPPRSDRPMNHKSVSGANNLRHGARADP